MTWSTIIVIIFVIIFVVIFVIAMVISILRSFSDIFDKGFWTPCVHSSHGIEEIKNDSMRPFAGVLRLPRIGVEGSTIGDHVAKLKWVDEIVQRKATVRARFIGSPSPVVRNIINSQSKVGSL